MRRLLEEMRHLRVAALIMAGGHGERFWPKSRTDAPKQFLPILPGERSVFQETYERAASIVGAENVFVVAGQSYYRTVLSQVPSLCLERIVLEPSGRNTAPCLALGTAKILGEF